jgi:hypothetical protein
LVVDAVVFDMARLIQVDNAVAVAFSESWVAAVTKAAMVSGVT